MKAGYVLALIGLYYTWLFEPLVVAFSHHEKRNDQIQYEVSDLKIDLLPIVC